MTTDLNTINNKITQDIIDKNLLPELLTHLGWEYTEERNGYRGNCFHPGCDGPHLKIFTNGERVKIHWKCFTQVCEDKYKPSLLGLVRGFLSAGQPKNLPIGDAIKFIKKFMSNFEVGSRKAADKPPPQPAFRPFPRDIVRQRLEIPSKFFVEQRGFSPDVLTRFDVGHSAKRGTEVCPLYDDNGKLCIGFIERTNLPECTECGLCHDDAPECDLAFPRQPKWRNSPGERPPGYLYGYHLARNSPASLVHVVEGPPDVWRAVEAGLTAVGLLGLSISESHLAKLDSLRKIIVLALDNDDRGREATGRLSAMLLKKGLPHLLAVIPREFKDFGDMPVERLREIERVGSRKDVNRN